MAGQAGVKLMSFNPRSAAAILKCGDLEEDGGGVVSISVRLAAITAEQSSSAARRAGIGLKVMNRRREEAAVCDRGQEAEE